MIKLVDRDGDTVKMSVEAIAACLKAQGNPPGGYVFVPNVKDFWAVGGNTVVGIKAIWFPKYSRFVLWRKKRRGSKLLDRRVRTAKGEIVVKAEPVWLFLKGKEAVPVFVE